MHLGYFLLIIINDSVSYVTVLWGGARDLPMEELELPTEGLKWPENAIFVHHFV